MDLDIGPASLLSIEGGIDPEIKKILGVSSVSVFARNSAPSTIDIDDLPSWPFPVIFVLALGGVAAVIASLVML